MKKEKEEEKEEKEKQEKEVWEQWADPLEGVVGAPPYLLPTIAII